MKLEKASVEAIKIMHIFIRKLPNMRCFPNIRSLSSSFKEVLTSYEHLSNSLMHGGNSWPALGARSLLLEG
jgi:hypothetical protein